MPFTYIDFDTKEKPILVDFNYICKMIHIQ